MPVYTLRNKVTSERRQTSDPGGAAKVARGFQYTQQEREDLVAFLQAL